MGGLGKTTMSKSLCNHFNKEFSGRVCYIEVKEEAKVLERQQMVMRKLLRLDALLVQRVCDISEGWRLLQSQMKKFPVFLAIDNVQFDGVSEEEAHEYLNVKFNSGSKIMVISRSPDVVEDLLGESRYCCQIPCLTRDEAAELFLQHGAPLMNHSSLTGDERRVVESCLEDAWFSHLGRKQSLVLHGEEPFYRYEGGHYHPLALRALGIYLHERSKTTDVLSWNTYLHEYRNLKDSRESYRRMFKILGLQFNTLDRMTQLMFLDINLYASTLLETAMLSNSPLEDLIAWLADIHGEPTEVVRSKIFDFKRFAIINIEGEQIIVHDLYKEYATWFLGQINREEVLGVWCVSKGGNLGTSLPLELQRTPPGRCWPDLKRIWLENIRCDGFLAGKVQEWCNVVVLQIKGCKYLTTINLQGLTCIRHLELQHLYILKTLTFIGDGGLERMSLWWYPDQKTLLNLSGLTSLRDLTVYCTSSESMTYEGGALKLEGLSSLISLEALELAGVPVADLSGLANLTHIEHISLRDMRYLTCLPPLNNVERFSLHVHEMRGDFMEGLDELKLTKLRKLEGFAAQGEIFATRTKIWERRFNVVGCSHCAWFTYVACPNCGRFTLGQMFVESFDPWL